MDYRGRQNRYENQNRSGYYMEGSTYHNDDRLINAENINIDTTLEQISREIKPGETLILDIGNNYYDQTDQIYDTLVMRGYDVKKTVRNGRNQIIVSKKA